MRKFLMKNDPMNDVRGVKVARMLLVALVAVICAGMWGCGLFDEDVTTTINEKRSDGRVIAILDDSLAFVFSGRRWDVFSESCDYWNNCDYGFINQGLFLVNYRKKQGPYWGDTIEGVLYTASGLAYDSTIFVYKDDDKFGFWKANGLPDIRKKMIWSKQCSGAENIQSVRLWKKGNVLLKMERLDNCPYAVLDTATGVVNKLEFTGEYAWLEGCDDITYIDGDVVCLKRLGKPTGTITLLNGGEVVDSLVYDHYTGNPPVFFGEYVAAYIYKKDYVEGNLIAKVSKEGFVHDFPETWLKSHAFIDSAGNSISYSSEDLIVTK